jgi:hypothetical protein
MLAEALHDILSTDAGLVALLGTPATRPDSTDGVFSGQAVDQPSMPYLVFEQAAGEPLSVTYAGTGPLTSERWRFSCYGTTYKNAKIFAKKVRLVLLDIVPGFNTVGNVRLSGAYPIMEADTTETIGRGTLFGTHVDFDVVYSDNASST